MEPIALVPGRSCEGCAMCCKLPFIKALDKPRDTWCSHCSTRKQCDIYDARPEPCRDYYCGWMRLAKIPQEWRPIDSRMIINFTEDSRHLFIHVDPARPDAWRRKPYLQHLRELARVNNPNGGQVIVSIGEHYIVVFPDREFDLGTMSDDETVTFTVTETLNGPVTEATKVKRVL
jgi:hypothetical protein